MAVFVAFSDESAVGDSQGTFLMGGYVADEKRWPCIVEAWQDRVLNGPPKIPYLHMIEIRDGDWRKEFGITYNDTENRVSEAVRVMFSSGAVSAIGAHLRRGDLADTIQCRLRAEGQRIPVGLNEPDYLCFLAYARLCLGRIHEDHPDVERVDFVISRKKKVSQHIGTFHEHLKALLSPPLDGFAGHLMPGEMKDHLPLQMADLLFWHMQRHFAGKMSRVDENRLWYLGEARGALHEITRGQLDQLADSFVTMVRTHKAHVR